MHKIDNDKFVDNIKSVARKIGSADYSARSYKAWKSYICQRVLQMMHVSGHKTLSWTTHSEKLVHVP